MNGQRDPAAWVLIAVIAALLLLRTDGCSIGGQPAPIPDPGLRVLITYSDATRDQLPAGQKSLIVSPTLRDWLDDHCVKNAVGDSEWRIWKDTTAPGQDQPIWQKLMSVPRLKSEWLLAGNGRNGISQPLPADDQSTIVALTPLGGGK